jgi:hypothetical protein
MLELRPEFLPHKIEHLCKRYLLNNHRSLFGGYKSINLLHQVYDLLGCLQDARAVLLPFFVHGIFAAFDKSLDKSVEGKDRVPEIVANAVGEELDFIGASLQRRISSGKLGCSLLNAKPISS